MLAFPETEYRERLRRTRAVMAEQGIDLLLCSHPASMCWLSGYDGWSFYVHQLVMVPVDESREPTWIGRGMDAAAARVTTWLPDDHIIAYGDDYVQSSTKHPLDFVADRVRDGGWERARIGVEMDTFYYTGRSHVSLTRALPEADVVDATKVVPSVKAIKSDNEIQFMERAARIVERAMRAAVDGVEAGRRQCDTAANIFHAQISGTAEFGGDYPAIVPMLPSGPGTNTPHLTWSDAPFRNGEATIIEIAGCYKRYNCPMARTVQLGEPPKKLADTAKVVVEGLHEAMATARPGNTAEEVELAWRRTIEKHGIRKESRLGYSTGLNYPPDWGEGGLSIRPGDKTELQENMTLHLIPGIWMDDWGLEISECVRIGSDGGHAFADFERNLIVK